MNNYKKMALTMSVYNLIIYFSLFENIDLRFKNKTNDSQ